MKQKIFITSIVVLVLVFAFYKQYTKENGLLPAIFSPRNQTETNFINQLTTSSEAQKEDIEIIASGLSVPWEIVFLPGGDMLVTERPGNLLRIGSTSKLIQKIEGVRHVGEGGLMGLALHPKFAENNYLYLYYTTEQNGKIQNTVERYQFTNNTLTDKKLILGNIKGSKNHDGGRIAFGPDGYLYIATGDAEEPDSAQDKNSLNGKILRVTDEGGVPADNPFGNPVYSIGHRNPQGLAWDSSGQLWVSEHGPSGLQTGFDEINLITRGGNYGWPKYKGAESDTGILPAALDSGKADTWAPSGMAYAGDSLFFSGLRGAALYQTKIASNNKLTLSTHLQQVYGRIRAVVLGPDNFLYISTSNTDGRGKPKEGDDKIIKLNPKLFYN